MDFDLGDDGVLLENLSLDSPWSGETSSAASTSSWDRKLLRADFSANSVPRR